MTKIKVPFSVEGFRQTERQLEAYKTQYKAKVEQFLQRLAEELRDRVEKNFDGSLLYESVKFSRRPDVRVSLEDRGKLKVIVADGEDAVWCEFGAGVYYNGAVGQSPNPYGQKLGFTIGSFGAGKGKQQAWGYYDEEGNVVITHGTPATMPMYSAVQDIKKDIDRIVKEVWR